MSIIRTFDFDYDVFDRMNHLLSHFENHVFDPTETQQAQRPKGQQTVQKRSAANAFYPPIDVLETKDSIKVHSELAGFKKENINLSLNNQTLTISGEKSNEFNQENKAEDGGKWKIQERHFGSFERRVVLPKNIDDQSVSAKFENGVLEVTIPKKQPPVEQKKMITIQ